MNGNQNDPSPDQLKVTKTSEGILLSFPLPAQATREFDVEVPELSWGNTFEEVRHGDIIIVSYDLVSMLKDDGIFPSAGNYSVVITIHIGNRRVLMGPAVLPITTEDLLTYKLVNTQPNTPTSETQTPATVTPSQVPTEAAPSTSTDAPAPAKVEKVEEKLEVRYKENRRLPATPVKDRRPLMTSMAEKLPEGLKDSLPAVPQPVLYRIDRSGNENKDGLSIGIEFSSAGAETCHLVCNKKNVDGSIGEEIGNLSFPVKGMGKIQGTMREVLNKNIKLNPEGEALLFTATAVDVDGKLGKPSIPLDVIMTPENVTNLTRVERSREKEAAKEQVRVETEQRIATLEGLMKQAVSMTEFNELQKRVNSLRQELGEEVRTQLDETEKRLLAAIGANKQSGDPQTAANEQRIAALEKRLQDVANGATPTRGETEKLRRELDALKVQVHQGFENQAKSAEEWQAELLKKLGGGSGGCKSGGSNEQAEQPEKPEQVKVVKVKKVRSSLVGLILSIVLGVMGLSLLGAMTFGFLAWMAKQPNAIAHDPGSRYVPPPAAVAPVVLPPQAPLMQARRSQRALPADIDQVPPPPAVKKQEKVGGVTVTPTEKMSRSDRYQTDSYGQKLYGPEVGPPVSAYYEQPVTVVYAQPVHTPVQPTFVQTSYPSYGYGGYTGGYTPQYGAYGRRSYGDWVPTFTLGAVAGYAIGHNRGHNVTIHRNQIPAPRVPAFHTPQNRLSGYTITNYGYRAPGGPRR